MGERASMTRRSTAVTVDFLVMMNFLL